MFRLKLILSMFCVIAGAPNLSIQSEKLDWWQTSVIYQIYPRSFQDSDGSGIGDLKGIINRADYFKTTRINAVWLSPIFESPQADLGYDISNYTAIDPIFGTIEDLMSLRKKLNSMDIKLILDFVPNHSSNQHIWFEKSIKRIHPFTDYYVWKNPKGWLNKTTPIPPNNWQSLTGRGTAWTFNKERGQFYLHQFLPQQPDLNYRSQYLLEEMKNVLRFFLDREVNGFRTDAVPYLVEDDRFLDEPYVNENAAKDPPTYDTLKHIYTKDQPETYDVLREFREVLDSYTEKGGPTRLLLTEAYTDIQHTMKYYGTREKPIAQVPFNFNLLTNLNDSSNAKAFCDTIYSWLNNMPKGRWPNWVIGNHDNPRVPTRFEPSAVDAINILVQLLPGTAITYNGEEIGMEDTKIRPDQSVDTTIPSRDLERTPFQWDSSLNAGFSSNKSGTWLPVNPNYYSLNLENQKKDPKSHYNVYKALVKLRSEMVFQIGDFSTCLISEYVFGFTRSLPKGETYLIVLNLNNEEEYVNLIACTNTITPIRFKIRIASGNSEYIIGDSVDSNSFKMRPKSAVVLQLSYS